MAGVLCFAAGDTHAQRHMERLGRGMVARRTGPGSVYVSWRLLATDPEAVGFNLYRIPNGGAPVQLNSQPLTNTTDYVDSGATLTQSNAWFVRPVTNGVELPAGAAYGLPANAPTRQYDSLPLRDTGGEWPPYDVKFCWVGDLDADGEYDFVVDRLSTVAATNQYVQAYKRDGTFLWQMDMGHNSVNQYSHEPGASAISVGMGDAVTVYDLDNDGNAEVIVRTARGVTVTNAAGAQVAAVTGSDDVTQYLSVFDGLSGVELARAVLPNPYIGEGPMLGHLGILYCDGVHPSVVYEGWNRNDSTGGDMHFNLVLTAWNYSAGQLTQRWSWDRGYGPYSDFHQIRVADVDHDGNDELCQGAYVIDHDGRPLFTTDLIHGDRFHITDIDPGRPGLETFAIQQVNPESLGMALYESGTGRMIRKWYQAAVSDVGRGMALDFDPRHKGVEMFSTMGGIYNCRGELTAAANPWPCEGLWWDGDLLRETMDGNNWNSAPYLNSPYVNKINYLTGGITRLLTVYSQGMHQAFGARSAFWGDILGDWREEFIVVSNDFSSLAIYTTTTPATNRLACLMQNPAYRCQATTKGYYEANYPDHYLGLGMAAPTPPPISDAHLVWRGNGTNVWAAAVAANWITNSFWSTNTARVVFQSGNSVLFDVTGSNNCSIKLNGALVPSAVTVYAPKDFTFAGSGSLTGPMRLVKAGAGALTLETTNDFTGATLVAEGPLVVHGALNRSFVTVRGGVWLDGRLAGNGFAGNGARIEAGGGIAPGAGTNSAGTLTVSNGVTFAGGAFACFDLSDDPSGAAKTNDLLNVLGDLTFAGTNEFVIQLLNASLSPGTYTLIAYSGSFSGNLAVQKISGIPGLPVLLTNPPGRVSLIVPPVRAPAALTWAGGENGNTWDTLASSNWLNGAARDGFNPGDAARFDDTGAANPVVSLAGGLNAGGVQVNSAADYTLGGSGWLMGAGGLVKTNSGTLTISNSWNTYTGRTVIGGGVLAIAGLNDAGYPSCLGAAGPAATNWVMYGGSTLRILGGATYTDRALTLNSGTNTIEMHSAGGLFSMQGAIVGNGGLAKAGPGTLTLSGSNSYSGGTVLEAGTLILASDAANRYGLGTGLVTLAGGALNMYDNRETYNSSYWNLFVPDGATAALNADSRCDLYGTLQGGGTLNFYVPFIRTTLYGNWSAFTGRINVSTDTDGGDFRVNNNYGYAGAAVFLGNNVWAYRNGGGSLSIGELSGTTGARLTGTTWTIGARNTDAAFPGLILGNSITKVGAGAWTLTGSNTFAGGTTVNAGTLLVNNTTGSGTGTGTVTVNSGGTLGGIGFISGAVTIHGGGTLAPGSSAGTLTLNSNLTLNSGAVLNFELGATNASDKIAVSGALALGGTLNVTGLAGFGAHTYTLITHGGALSGNLPAIGTKPAGYSCVLQTNTPGQVRLFVQTQAPPVFGSATLSNGWVVLGGTGGPPGSEYYVLTSTNLALPAGMWTRLATNLFDAGGFSFADALIPGRPQQFYRLQLP